MINWSILKFWLQYDDLSPIRPNGGEWWDWLFVTAIILIIIGALAYGDYKDKKGLTDG